MDRLLLQNIEDQFDAYRKQSIAEENYLCTDKNIYLTGEILWMKLYDVDSFFHMPFAVSSIAYGNIDKGNKSVLQAKIGLNKGDGNGSIYLPVTLNSAIKCAHIPVDEEPSVGLF
jgi:hypothetical protein